MSFLLITFEFGDLLPQHHIAKCKNSVTFHIKIIIRKQRIRNCASQCNHKLKNCLDYLNTGIKLNERSFIRVNMSTSHAISSLVQRSISAHGTPRFPVTLPFSYSRSRMFRPSRAAETVPCAGRMKFDSVSSMRVFVKKCSLKFEGFRKVLLFEGFPSSCTATF